MAHLTLATVDAFTSKPFSGNPAAICLLEQAMPEAWMQSVAAEMNLSETAFLLAQAEGYGLRWFTPTSEVDLCGHATLGSAHFLWESGILSADQPALFHTRSGLLTAKRLPEEGSWIELDFPQKQVDPAEAPGDLEKILGAKPVFIGNNKMDFLVEVESEETVRNLKPDFAALAQIEARGVIVTARSGGEADIVSRCFFPRVGIDEDPVTGSAHCALGPYWAARLGKKELLAFQASKRGGWMRLQLVGDRIRLIGQAVTVTRGQLLHAER
ncbi:PhzF family phenazine biosynthesis protein [Silvibacterium acidisoli]|uniref:PhzF family phenazine biosynthesis protein n=1 Tax=Acidobacteriaceae bacterium ZG23-2 TaxID=2883246 RepID=UPI00406CADB5